MFKNENAWYAAALAVIAVVIAADVAFTVSATGDVRCLVVKCVVIKK
jgi:hypothetical protein